MTDLKDQLGTAAERLAECKENAVNLMAAVADGKVGRCRFMLSKPVFKLPMDMVSALKTIK